MKEHSSQGRGILAALLLAVSAIAHAQSTLPPAAPQFPVQTLGNSATASRAQDAGIALAQGNAQQAIALFGEALKESGLTNERRATLYNDRGVAYWRALQHKAAEDRDSLSRQLRYDQVRQLLVVQAALEGGLSAMVDGSLTLLDAIDAQGAALFHEERWWRIGQTPEVDDLERIAEFLIKRPEFASAAEPVFVTIVGDK